MINKYIQDHSLAWAPSTLKSESARLRACEKYLDDNPLTLWSAIQNKKPYSRVTIWTRVTNYYKWLVNNGEKENNPYENFRKKNARLFKNAYIRRPSSKTLQEAKLRISKIKDTDIREKATQILSSGLRFKESQILEEGFTQGKGSKFRKTYAERVEFTKSYSTFNRALKEVGLKPHELRKIFLTEVVRMGLGPFELCELAGWASIETARSYIQANSNEIKDMAEKIKEKCYE